MRSAYELLVIGGGPAGAIAARTAAKAGHSVLLVEKRPAIGAPVRCAEGIGSEGLSQFVRPDDRWISARTRRTELVVPDGRSLLFESEMGGEKGGYVLDRKIFDRELVRQAAQAGAEVMVRTRASAPLMDWGRVKGAVLESGGEQKRVEAAVTIAADGVESAFSRWCGVDTRIPVRGIMSCAQYLVTGIPIDPERKVMFLGRLVAPGGYLWIFPKGDTMANVGIGIPGDQSGTGHRACDYLDRFVRERFPTGKTIESVVGGVPVCLPPACTVADGLMIAGDAARVVDPLTGGGIYNAMFTGDLAAQVASKAIRSGQVDQAALMPYDQGWRSSEVGRIIARSSRIREHFITFTDEDLDLLISLAAGRDLKGTSVLGLITDLIHRIVPDARL